MRNPWLVALTLTAVLTATDTPAQTRAPVQGDRVIQPPRQLPFAPRPNGAFACFADQGSPLNVYSPLPDPVGRDLSGFAAWSMRMTNDQCRATCASRNFIYAGTQSGAFCFCGNTAGSFGATNAVCSAGCTGSLGEICGGSLANSVSLSGSLGFAPPPVPPPPPNGGQCVIDLSGPAYRHFELQRWEVNGPPMMGANGKIYPMSWTVTGGGGSQQVTVSGRDTTILIRSWTISGKSDVSYLATILNNGALYFHENSTVGSGSLQEAPQRKYIDGALQTPGMSAPGPWPEFSALFTLSTPNPAAIQNAQLLAVNANHSISNIYAAPAGWSGTVNCSWNVVR